MAQVRQSARTGQRAQMALAAATCRAAGPGVLGGGGDDGRVGVAVPDRRPDR
jgi:hypothetical protein